MSLEGASRSEVRRFRRGLSRRERRQYGVSVGGTRLLIRARGRKVVDATPRQGKHAHSYARHAEELRRHAAAWGG